MRFICFLGSALCFGHAWFLGRTWNQIIEEAFFSMTFMFVAFSLPRRKKYVERPAGGSYGALSVGRESVEPNVELVDTVQASRRTLKFRAAKAIATRLEHTVPEWMTDPAMAREWRKQDVLGAAASYYAERGGVTDDMVRADIAAIRRLPLNRQYDAFDLLVTKVINGHPDGQAADVYQEVSRAAGDSVMEYDRRRDEFEGKAGTDVQRTA